MDYSKKKGLYLSVLLLFSLPLFFYGIHDAHGWGDDFAQYIKEAENIAAGRPFYQSGYIFNELSTQYAPPQYPPGFPLLLAPVVKIWGIDIRAMLYMQSLIAALTLFSFFFYFKKYISPLYALCLAVAGIYCSSIIGLKQEVLSDIPCLLFVTLYFNVRIREKHSLQDRILLILLAAMILLIRTQMILLLAAEGIYFLLEIVRRKGTRSFRAVAYSPSTSTIAGSLLLYGVLSRTLFRTPDSTFNYYLHFFQPLADAPWAIIGKNANYLLEQLSGIFHHQAYDPFWQSFTSFIVHTGVVAGIAGFVISIRNRIEVTDLFFILICLLILILPVYQGFRFMLPVLPIYLMYVYRFLRLALPLVVPVNRKAAAIIISAFFLVLAYDDLDRSSDLDTSWTPYTPEDSSAFSYLRANVPDSSIIIFTKPRLLTLYTGKKTIVLAEQLSHEENKKKMDAAGADYVLTRVHLDDGYYKDYLSNTHTPVDTIQINDKYSLFKIKH